MQDPKVHATEHDNESAESWNLHRASVFNARPEYLWHKISTHVCFQRKMKL